MRVCGVEIKASEAVICVMTKADGLYDLPHIRVPKIAIQDGMDTEQVRKFQFDFAKLLQDYKIDQVAIKARPVKGKFAGGAVGFKLEAAIQLIADVQVEIMHGHEIKDILHRNEILIDFRDTGLKKFQQTAFETAFAFLSRR